MNVAGDVFANRVQTIARATGDRRDAIEALSKRGKLDPNLREPEAAIGAKTPRVHLATFGVCAKQLGLKLVGKLTDLVEEDRFSLSGSVKLVLAAVCRTSTSAKFSRN